MDRGVWWATVHGVTNSRTRLSDFTSSLHFFHFLDFWLIYTIEYYSVLKGNEIMLFTATWVGLEIIMLSELSEKDKYHVISLTCGI